MNLFEEKGRKWISEKEKKRWNGDLWTDLFRFIHIVNAHKNLCEYFISICCGEVLWAVCTQNQENRNNLFSNELKFSNDFYEKKKNISEIVGLDNNSFFEEKILLFFLFWIWTSYEWKWIKIRTIFL